MANGDESEMNRKEKTLNCARGCGDRRGSGRGSQGAGRECFGDRFCSHYKISAHIRNFCYSLYSELRQIRAAKMTATNPATASFRILTEEEYSQFRSLLSGVSPSSSQTPTATMARDKGARDLGHTSLNWQKRARIILHVARAMAFIHSQSPLDDKHFRTNVHGNIKPANIFITTDFSARLSDYGFSQLASPIDVLNAARPRKPLPTTLQAEIVRRKPSQKEDVFNFGVMVLEMLGGARAPYQVHCIVERIEEIRAGSCHLFEYFVEGKAKDEACSMLEVAIACMDSIAEARPSAGDIVASITDALSPSPG